MNAREAGKPVPPAASDAHVVMEEAMVSARDSRIQIYVRNKHLEGLNRSAGQETVLLVHGATFPSETTFDFPINGTSWMDYIALRGYDVYMMDIRGYGRSTRPQEMSMPPDKNAPIVDTETAVRDIGTVVDHVLVQRGVSKLNLLGMSWGTSTTATYTASNPSKVHKLVLYAPGWFRETPTTIHVDGSLGAYRTVTREAAFERWMTGVPEEKKAGLIPAGVFDQWWEANLAADPVGSKQNPPVVRAPNGVLMDDARFWATGRATYDPARIVVPVLLIHAEWDQDTPAYMAHALFPLLVNAPKKRYVVIGEGTHSVIFERNRIQLFREVQTFLDEGASTEV